MEVLEQDLTYLISMLGGEFDILKEKYPHFLKLVVDLAILQYSLLYALRKSNVVDDEEIEKALLKAQMKFDELRLKFSSTSGMC